MGRLPRQYEDGHAYHLTAHGVDDRLRVLNGAYSRAFNARHERRGPVFEARYRDREIRDERHLLEAIRYVEWNAEKDGRSGDWPWRNRSGV